MRLIDADELMEHAWRDKLDSRELIAEMIENAPTIEIYNKIGHDLMECCRMLEKYTIPIPPNATNGDMIKAMFPNAQIDYHEKSDLVDDYVTVFIKGCDTCQDYSYDWWNAPYEGSDKE